MRLKTILEGGNTMTIHPLVPCILGVMLTSCMVGPNYKRPPTTVPLQFKEAKGPAFHVKPNNHWIIAHPKDTADRGMWWTVFHDEQLNKLECDLNVYNQNIATTLAAYEQSRQIVEEARANLYPTLSGVLSTLRQKGGGFSSFINTSGATGTTSSGTATTGGGGSGSSIIRTSLSGYLNANWEPDVWGQFRRTVEGDVAAAQSNDALIASTRLSAQGALAQYYFELQALDKDQELLDHTVLDYKKTLQLTKNQYASGVASRADIVQAQAQLEIAQAKAINNGILRGQYEHAIATLIGRPPADLSIAYHPLNTTPPKIPVTIPSVWLERRPDIAQAERLMQQANAQIGIAISAYYPSLDLSASLSAAGTSLGRLFHTPQIGWSYASQIADVIFDGGLRGAAVNAAKAGYMAQVASYRQAVLTAFQDVEDNLIALRLLKEEGIVQNKAAASAEMALRLVINQYKSGTVPYASVLTAQINAYTAQKNAYDVVGLQMTAAVGLIKSLGGGWSVSDIHQV